MREPEPEPEPELEVEVAEVGALKIERDVGLKMERVRNKKTAGVRNLRLENNGLVLKFLWLHCISPLLLCF